MWDMNDGEDVVFKDILPELNGKDYIEALNKDYEIRFCKEEEYEELINFLKNNWKKGHIFTKSKKVLDFQHLDSKNHRYNFVIAKHRKSGEIHSILGFVPNNQYGQLNGRRMIWPCIWKSREDIDRKGLGVSLYYYLKKTLRPDTIEILGISEIALSIYKHWNFQTGKIEHYFLPNPKKISVISKGFETLEIIIKERAGANKDSAVLRLYTQEDYEKIPDNSSLFMEMSTYKNKGYYIGRFYQHPVYKYHLFAIEIEGVAQAIVVSRECTALGSKCLRIVDYIGKIKMLSTVSNQLLTLMKERNYEYIDFVEVGLDDESLKRAGFLNKKEYSGVIIPNYFEPFLRENVDLDYAFKTVDDSAKLIYFKADADQDRPNIL